MEIIQSHRFQPVVTAEGVFLILLCVDNHDFRGDPSEQSIDAEILRMAPVAEQHSTAAAIKVVLCRDSIDKRDRKLPLGIGGCVGIREKMAQIEIQGRDKETSRATRDGGGIKRRT